MTTTSTSARFSSSNAGPSSKTQRGRRSATDTRSRAEPLDSSDSDDSTVVSKKAPRRKQVAPAGNRGRKGADQPRRLTGPRRQRGRRAESDGSQETDVGDGLLEPSDDDAKPPPKGLTPHQIRSLIRAAERRVRKKLGRKLTIVRPSTYRNFPWADDCFFVPSVRSRQLNSTSSTQNSRAVGEISRSLLPSSPLRRPNSLRTYGPRCYRSSRKACIG